MSFAQYQAVSRISLIGEGHQLGITSNHADVMHWFRSKAELGRVPADVSAEVARITNSELLKAVARSAARCREGSISRCGPVETGVESRVCGHVIDENCECMGVK